MRREWAQPPALRPPASRPKPTRPHQALTRQRRVAQRPGHPSPGLLEAPSQEDAGLMFALTPSEQPTCPKPGSDGSKKGQPIPASRPEPGQRQPRATQGSGWLVQAGGSEEGQRKGTDPPTQLAHLGKRRHRAFWRGSLAIPLLGAHGSEIPRTGPVHIHDQFPALHLPLSQLGQGQGHLPRQVQTLQPYLSLRRTRPPWL